MRAADPANAAVVEVTEGHRLDSPIVPMAVTLVLATGFVVLRWLDAAHREIGQFVVLGTKYSTASALPKDVPVISTSGYDGQFYFRLALNPFNLSRNAYGIRLDSISRVERLAYPFLAWALALGHHDRIPLTLVIVNVIAAGVLGLAGGMLAQSAGRHAAWGLVFPLYWGYLWTLGRDLTELTAAAFVMLGLVALVRRRPLWTGIAFLAAVLSKETAVLVVGTLALTSLWLRWREHSSVTAGRPVTAGAPPIGVAAPRATTSVMEAPGRTWKGLSWRASDVAYAIPLVGFVLWQVVLLMATGKVPIYKSGGENLGPPVVGLVHGVAHYVSAFPDTASLLWFGELTLIVVLIAAAARWRHRAPPEFRVLWVVSIILGLCAATGIWLGDVGFRSLDDIYLLCWVVLLFQRQRVWPWAVLCAGAWIVVCVELIRFI